MKYSLTVTLNFADFVLQTKEVSHSELNQRQMFEIAQDYLNDPGLSSAIFTVVPLRSSND